VALGAAVLPFTIDLSTQDGPGRLVGGAVEEFGVLDRPTATPM
jgi:hypothetical protein